MALRSSAIAAVAGLALFAAVPAHADAPKPHVVVFADSVDHPRASTRDRERRLHFRARFRYEHAVKGFAADLTAAQVSALRNDPAVAIVSPDRPVHAMGSGVEAGETVPVGIRRLGAVRDTVGRGPSGATVAVIDTGIDLANPDLDARPGVNCMSGGTPTDDHGHGTHVAGTIGARNTGAGVVGVAPGTPVYAVKVLDQSGRGSTSSVICGIDWVTDNAAALGIKVANMSLGGSGPLGTCTSDPERAAICRSTAAGVTYVVAAGNSGAQITATSGQAPAVYPEVLTVTAVSDSDGLPGGFGGNPDCGAFGDDVPAGFSNFGVGSGAAAHMIAAPGVCVTSTARGGGLVAMSGTSMAAPHVAGLAALCIDEGGVAGPCAGLAPAQVMATLRSAAARHANLANGFSGDPLRPVSSRYYGHLAWAGPSPRVETSAPASIDDRAATAAGSVDVDGNDSRWWVEYGATTAYGLRTADQATSAIGSQPVQSELPDLLPATEYHYRVVADTGGWLVAGADRVFTTTGDPAPDTQIDSRPPDPVADASADLVFSATGGPAPHFECRLDGADWETCTSPVSFQDLTEARHRFDVRAVGTDDVPDPSYATASWRVDLTAPETTLVGAPEDPSVGPSASFALAASEAGSSFACRLDGGPWIACGPAVGYARLAVGPHVFEARATDRAGNVDSSPVAKSWHVVEPAPETETASGGAGTMEAPGSQATPPLVAVLPALPALPRKSVIVLSTLSPLRGGRGVLVRLACRGPSACAGVLELRSRAVRAGTVVGSNLARAGVQIAAGRRASIGVMLRAAGLRALRRGPLAAYVVLRAPTAQNLGRAVLRAPSTNPKR